MLKKPKHFGTDTWSIVVPTGWRAYHESECSTLLDGSDIGALQISAMFKDDTILDEELRDLASDKIEAGAITRDVFLGNFVGFEIAFTVDEIFWRQWFLRHKDQCLFITYNCDLRNRNSEKPAISDILASLSSSR